MLNKFTIYRNPGLFRLMNSKKYLYVNATFHYLLKGYKQLLVFIIHNKMTITHINVLHILMNSVLFYYLFI